MRPSAGILLALFVVAGIATSPGLGDARKSSGSAGVYRDLPKSERAAASEITKLIEARRYEEASARARELTARVGASRRVRREALADAYDLRAQVLLRWRRPNDREFAGVADTAVSLREGGDPTDPRWAASLERAGIARIRRVEYAAADSLLARAVAARRAARPPDDHATAVTLGFHAEAQRVNKKLDAARVTATEALEQIRRSAPDDTSAEMRMHNTLGNTLAEQGKAAEARVELERALELESRRARPDSLAVAQTRRFLARTLLVQGEVRLAQSHLDQAAAIQERVLGPNHAELATTLYMASFATADAGDFVASRRYAERVVRIREAAFGPEHNQVGVALMQLGGTLRNLGDLERSRECLERAVAIQRRASPPAPADLASALSNLGALRIAMGDAGGKAHLEEAIAIRQRVFGSKSGPGFWVSTRLAHAMVIEGKPAEAEAQLEDLLAAPGSRNPLDDVDALEVLGAAAWSRADLAKAERSFSRAFALNDSVLGINSSRTLSTLALRATARWARGDRAGALADARRCEEVGASTLRLTARALAEHEALAFANVRGSGLDVMLSLATDSIGLSGPDRAAVLDAVVRSRLAVLDELADEARALPRHDPELAPLVRDLDQARATLSEAMVGAMRHSERTSDSLIVAARGRREAAERALAEKSGAFRDTERRSVAGLEVIARALPRGSALVSYVRFQRPGSAFSFVMGDSIGAAQTARAGGGQYAAFVLRAGEAAPIVVRIGGAAELEPMIDRWASALATPPPPSLDVARAAQRRCDGLGAAVRARVWDPVARRLGSASQVFMVPEGGLHAVSLLALPTDRRDYMAERGPLIHRLTAERDLVPWEGAAADSGQGMLAMGGADFDRAEDSGVAPALASASGDAGTGGASADDAGGITIGLLRSSIPDSARLRFPALPQTGAEAAEVAQLWRGAGAGDVVELKGAAASEAAFKRLAPGREVIHVATHGFALGASTGMPGEGVRGIGGVGTEAPPAPSRAGPLVPGLALAGANTAAGPEAEDGFLTAEEITALDLGAADWAVLSACETGLSDAHAVEAVQGLHRAFRRAGARTVIMSLWAVDDVATRAWMRRLYEARVRERQDTARSVREACRSVLRERRAAGLDTHPFHWAAFVASGDWR